MEAEGRKSPPSPVGSLKLLFLNYNSILFA